MNIGGKKRDLHKIIIEKKTQTTMTRRGMYYLQNKPNANDGKMCSLFSRLKTRIVLKTVHDNRKRKNYCIKTNCSFIFFYFYK